MSILIRLEHIGKVELNRVALVIGSELCDLAMFGQIAAQSLSEFLRFGFRRQAREPMPVWPTNRMPRRKRAT